MDRIVAQRVTLRIGEHARAAIGAAARGEFALARPLPDELLEADGDRMHGVDIGDGRRATLATSQTVQALVPRPLDGLYELTPQFAVARIDAGLRVSNVDHAGASPAMRAMLPIELATGTWIQLRTGWRSHRLELEAVLNVGRFTRPVERDEFATTPAKRIDLRPEFQRPR